jgi:hypothetical protein
LATDMPKGPKGPNRRPANRIGSAGSAIHIKITAAGIQVPSSPNPNTTAEYDAPERVALVTPCFTPARRRRAEARQLIAKATSSTAARSCGRSRQPTRQGRANDGPSGKLQKRSSSCGCTRA